MHPFDDLLALTDKLQSPEGCPWDRSQTFDTLKAYVLEEAHELLEAVDEGEDKKIIEELGDLMYTVVFYGKIAEKTERFTIWDVIKTIHEKLVRRHPHVFGDVEAKDVEEVKTHWERIKKEEMPTRKSALDGIPKTLPSLARAQKVLGRMHKQHYQEMQERPSTKEKKLAADLLRIVADASKEDIDIESAFRSLLKEEEEKFRTWETTR